MSSTIQPFKPMSTRFKARQKQYTHKQNMTTLSQLLKTPNITIKKTMLKNIQFIDITKLKKTEFINVSKAVERAGNKKVQKPKIGKQIKKKAQPKPTEPKEYYPQLAKRNAEPKEIKLKPKHSYKIVGTINKRKRGIPHYYTEIKSLPPIQNNRKSPTIEELVRLADEDLNDEDFLEILTCPSPVWWEDHEEYSSEEDINQNMDEGYEEILNDLQNHSQKFDTRNIPTKTDGLPSKNSNDEYKGKRSKLENILGNIKHKKLKTNDFNEISDDRNKNSHKNKDSDRKSDNSDELHENSDIKSKDCSINNSDNIKDNSDQINDNSDVNDNSDTSGNSDKYCKERKSSLSGLSDTSISEDLLKTLENIEIPVKDHCEDENDQINGNNGNDNNENGTIENDKIDGDKKDDKINCVCVMDKMERNGDKNNTKITTKVKKSQDKSQLVPTRKSKRKSPIKIKYYEDFEVFHEIKRKRKSTKEDVINNDNTEINELQAENNIELNEIKNEIPNLVPNVLPKLKKYPVNKNTENLKISKDVEMDSISDTNIKYLDEFDEKCNNIDDLVTIYKILPTEPEEIDVEDQIIANLLSKDRFKQKSKKNLNDMEQEENKCVNKDSKTNGSPKPIKKNVAQYKNTNKKASVASKMNKYCHTCSSIFDTDSCQYCVKKGLEK